MYVYLYKVICILIHININICRHDCLHSNGYGLIYLFTWTNIPMYKCTAHCIWSVISPISKLNLLSSSRCLFCHVPLKRDQLDCDWRLRLNDTPNVIGCMGWLRLVGSSKFQVSFAKEPYKRDYIVQKRPVISRSILIEATPYLSTLTIIPFPRTIAEQFVSGMYTYPPEKLLGGGLSTPVPPFCLVCTIISSRTCILD